MTVLGIDTSHWQGAVDFGAVKRAGYSFAFLQATDGVGVVDGMFATSRSRARAAGMTVGYYHFAQGGDPTAEADHFCATVGTLAVGELVALDWETTAADPPSWCRVWLDRVRDRLGVHPLIYMNQRVLAGFDWSQVVAGDYGLWLAKYDFTQSVPQTGAWSNVAIKQFSDRGSVPGVSGGVDLDVFFGSAATLARYGKQPPPPPPPPAPAPVPPVSPTQLPFLEELMAVSPADRAALIDDIAQAVRSDQFTITTGPGKGTKIADQTALRDLYQNVQALQADVAAIKRKLGA